MVATLGKKAHAAADRAVKLISEVAAAKKAAPRELKEAKAAARAAAAAAEDGDTAVPGVLKDVTASQAEFKQAQAAAARIVTLQNELAAAKKDAEALVKHWVGEQRKLVSAAISTASTSNEASLTAEKAAETAEAAARAALASLMAKSNELSAIDVSMQLDSKAVASGLRDSESAADASDAAAGKARTARTAADAASAQAAADLSLAKSVSSTYRKTPQVDEAGGRKMVTQLLEERFSLLGSLKATAQMAVATAASAAICPDPWGCKKKVLTRENECCMICTDHPFAHPEPMYDNDRIIEKGDRNPATASTFEAQDAPGGSNAFSMGLPSDPKPVPDFVHHQESQEKATVEGGDKPLMSLEQYNALANPCPKPSEETDIHLPCCQICEQADPFARFFKTNEHGDMLHNEAMWPDSGMNLLEVEEMTTAAQQMGFFGGAAAGGMSSLGGGGKKCCGSGPACCKWCPDITCDRLERLAYMPSLWWSVCAKEEPTFYSP
eukprot:PLAT365.1.p1 GENE.PLAT365.1~~PLAT365.1.p1  ORF type:complete len:538 (+),score=243.93 PLAT365.1:129-1616(+)